jgi:hypothetical protein
LLLLLLLLLVVDVLLELGLRGKIRTHVSTDIMVEGQRELCSLWLLLLLLHLLLMLETLLLELLVESLLAMPLGHSHHVTPLLMLLVLLNELGLGEVGGESCDSLLGLRLTH